MMLAHDHFKTSVDAQPSTHLWRRAIARLLSNWSLVVAVLVGAASACGLLIRHPLSTTPLVRFDQRLALDLVESRTASLDRLTGWGTFPADPVPVASIWAVAMLVAFLLTRRAAPPLFILLAVGGEKTTYFVTTLIVRRPRPDVPTIGARHVTSSFPSGHVGSSVSLYGSIAILVLMHSRHRSVGARAVAVGLVAIIATVVAYCRMYRGFHFLTDVVVGSLIGAVWLPIALRLVALLPDKRHGAGEVSRTRHQRRRADASRSAV